jgi:hypothetical protein
MGVVASCGENIIYSYLDIYKIYVEKHIKYLGKIFAKSEITLYIYHMNF